MTESTQIDANVPASTQQKSQPFVAGVFGADKIINNVDELPASRLVDGFQTSGAYVLLDFAAPFVECGPLNVGSKDAACLPLREAHIVAGHGPLAT